MKLKINDKYEEVGFWSFFKCMLLVQIGVFALFWGIIMVLYFFAGFA